MVLQFVRPEVRRSLTLTVDIIVFGRKTEPETSATEGGDKTDYGAFSLTLVLGLRQCRNKPC